MKKEKTISSRLMRIGIATTAYVVLNALFLHHSVLYAVVIGLAISLVGLLVDVLWPMTKVDQEIQKQVQLKEESKRLKK